MAPARSQRRSRSRPQPRVSKARDKAEASLKQWSASVLKILKPAEGGHTEIPAAIVVAHQGDDVVAAVDDLVELVAAYGYDYRTEAEGAVAASRTTMLGIAIGTVLIGLIIALAFAFSLSRPIFAALNMLPSAWPPAISADDIRTRRRDELGRLLKSLAVMQASLKARPTTTSP